MTANHNQATKLQSFVASANTSTTDFSIYNLPYGVFKSDNHNITTGHIGIAIGDYVLDLYSCVQYKLLNDLDNNIQQSLQQSKLNSFMAFSPDIWLKTRNTIQKLLSNDSILSHNNDLQARVLILQSEITLLLPCDIGDYTDFYSSMHHARNVGIMFRGVDNALPVNWRHLPIGYHGRSSSIVVSGHNIHRPHGQLQTGNTPASTFGICKNLDFELELGFFIGNNGNQLGQPITIDNASDYIFGYCLLNDWSARDIQRWEYVPLGPFGAKNFASTISPWIVTSHALNEFKVNISQLQDNPKPLKYLTGNNNSATQQIYTYDIKLNVAIQTDRMRQQNIQPQVICESNANNLYWSFTQQLTHHTITGCNMRNGDLCGSGTISGEQDNSYGSMLELCWNRTKNIDIQHTSEQRQYIEDNDKIIITGYCHNNTLDYRIGFGECSGIILPPVKYIYE